eukprot:6357934-Amphidinium_carterae.1
MPPEELRAIAGTPRAVWYSSYSELMHANHKWSEKRLLRLVLLGSQRQRLNGSTMAVGVNSKHFCRQSRSS